MIDETDGAELAPGEVDPAGGDLGSVTISGANLFTDTSVFGTDGAAGSGARVYRLLLSADGADSGIDDTVSGNDVLMFIEGNDIVGREGGGAGEEVFRVSIAADTGDVTVTLSRAVVHGNPADSDEAATPEVIDPNLLSLMVTIKDGDQDTDTAQFDLGSLITFEDDGPSISRNAVAMPTLTTDDSDIEDSASTSFAGLFTTAFGADGFKDSDGDDAEDTDAVTYALGVKTMGADSGIDDTLSGDDILLRLNAATGEVEGYLANDTGVLAFVIGVDADSGDVTLTQKRAVLHDDITDPVESGASAATLGAADLITITATATDGDGDTDTASANIGGAFTFEDDGPSIGAIDKFVVDYTTDEEGTGSTTLNASGGADRDASFRITAYKGDDEVIIVNGITLTAQLTNNDTKILYYADGGAAGDYDGGIDDVLYYTYELIDTGDAGSIIDSAEFTVHNAPSAGDLLFDLNELPSGQNLFGILSGKAEDETEVNPDGPALVVIGRDVVLEEDGSYSNISDTVNTSQGGGPTTIANTNQIIEAGEGLYFAYVSDPNDSFLSAYMDADTEGLDQNEADNANNIEYFGGTIPVGGVAFVISQVQGSELAALKISAWDSVGDGTPGSGLQGEEFALNPIAGGTQIEVTSVRVFDAEGNKIEDTDDLANFDDETVQVLFEVSGDAMSAVVTGLDAGYTVEFRTADNHDISLIEGVSGKFDIGGFTLIEAIPTPDQIFDFTVEITDGDGDTEEASHSVRIDGTGIYDDDPLPIGTEGDDTLIGTPGDDEILGLGGDDILIGLAGFDTLDGGAGNDTVAYSSSDAGVSVALDGWAGGGYATGDVLISIENLIGSAYADTLTGDGQDNVLVGGGGGDILDGGAGLDTADYSDSAGAVSASLVGPGANGDAEGDQLISIERLVGSAFGDTLTGDSSANTLIGGDGDDTLAGGAGADVIDGGNGSDTADYFASNAAVSIVLGGAVGGGHAMGDVLTSIENLTGSNFGDTLTGDGNANILSGGGGDDTLDGSGGDDTLAGGAGADTLKGGSGSDTADYSGSATAVFASLTGPGAGGDAAGDLLTSIENLIGSGFGDTLTGDGNANALTGGDGNDILAGGAGADMLDGGTGSDTVDYSASNAAVSVMLGGAVSGGHATGDVLTSIENLIGSDFADTLTGDANANTLSGGDGGDTLVGGAGVDTVDYSESNAAVSVDLAGAVGGGHATGDVLTSIENVAGSGFGDTLTGDGGDNTLAGGAGADTLDGGAGSDTADYSTSNAGVSVALNGAVSGGHATGDTLTAIENLTGSAFADTLSGDGQSNTLTGGAGKDTLFGGAGDDSLIGGDDADNLFGGAGNDTFDGGAGNDTFFVDASGDVVTDGGSGFDKVVINNAAGVSLAVGGFLNIERVNGFTGDDTIDATGFVGTIVLSGGAGNDTLTGGSGNDILLGGAGDDSLVGGDGNDAMLGGTGNDTFDGGAGDDIFFIGETGDTVTDGGDGFDKASVNNAAGVNISVGSWLSVERVNGFTGDDVIDATGNTVGIILDGRGGNDELTGGSGGDTFFAGIGDDTLRGAGGNDALIAGAGADTLDGGTGNDFLLGGAGADTFVFSDGWGTDTLKDWQDGSDTLDFIGHSGVTGIGDLGIAQVGADTHITFGPDTVILVGVTATDIDGADFVFTV